MTMWFPLAAQALRLLLWLVLLSALFLPAERWLALRGQRLPWRTVANDLLYFFAGGFVPMLLLGAPLAFAATLVQPWMPPAAHAALAALPRPAALLLSFVIAETGFYWAHRLCHAVPLLWRFHAIHHGPDQLYYLVNTHAHPVDLVFTRLVGLLPLYALGLAGPTVAGSAAPVALILLGTTWGFFVHANLRVRLGPLEYLLATPFFHHWHHTRDGRRDGNFAAMLPALDALFGTLHRPAHWPGAYGVDLPQPASFLGQLLAPLRRQASDA